jgi:hypothetical protein
VAYFTLQSIIQIGSDMYIHVSPRKHFFRNSIILNIGAQGFIVTIMWNASAGFKAILNDCNNIWAYYEIIGQTALSDQMCRNAIVFYALWFVVSVIMIAVRGVGLWYMIKSYRYLLKREAEKLRKRQRRLEKERRIRKEKRRALQKQALE